MDVSRLTEPREYLERAGPLLLADEPRHNLLFGIVDTLIHHPALYPASDLWLVTEGDEVLAAALQTPPFNLVLARPAVDAALDALVEAIAAAGVRLPGVTAVRPEAEAFAERWTDRAGATRKVRMAQGVYALHAVRAVPTVAGASRPATTSDRPLLERSVVAFIEEAVVGPTRDPGNARRMIAARLEEPPERGGVWLWEVGGEVVSLSGHGGPTPNGMRIGPVYTPPEHRRRGYATALVAEQSAWLLSTGRRFCFLFTDLANPTSNGVYRRIGYEQVGEALDIAFEPPAG
jgi:hypothetical protein